MKQIFIVAFIVLLLAACHDQHQQHEATHEHNAATESPTTKEDSLYREVIALHDAVMPKMGKLIGYKKNLMAKVDSLEKMLVTKKDKEASLVKERYQRLLEQVAAAEKSMNDWMDQFNPDPQLPAKEDMIRYFEEQKTKATKMRNDVLTALDSAAARQ